MSIWEVFLGLGMIAIGTIGLIYSRQIFNFTGRLSSVESKWAGGTSSFLKLVAVLLVLLGILTTFGIMNLILAPIGDYFARLIPGGK